MMIHSKVQFNLLKLGVDVCMESRKYCKIKFGMTSFQFYLMTDKKGPFYNLQQSTGFTHTYSRIFHLEDNKPHIEEKHNFRLKNFNYLQNFKSFAKTT